MFRPSHLVVAVVAASSIAVTAIASEGRSGHPACDKFWVEKPDGVTVGRLHGRYSFVPPRSGPAAAYACVMTTIDEEGRVTEVKLLETDHPPVGAAAIEQISKWRFSPATKDGRGVSYSTLIVVGYGGV